MRSVPVPRTVHSTPVAAARCRLRCVPRSGARCFVPFLGYVLSRIRASTSKQGDTLRVVVEYSESIPLIKMWRKLAGVVAAALLTRLADSDRPPPWWLGAPLQPPVLFVCRDAGETLAFLPVLEILNGDSRPTSETTSMPHAVALATTLNAAQRLSDFPAAVVLTWERLGLPGTSDQHFQLRNATLSPASLAVLLSQLQVRPTVRVDCVWAFFCSCAW